MIYQTESAECGLACLTMILGAHQSHFDLSAIRERFPTSIRGVTARRIIEIGQAFELQGRTLALPLNALPQLTLPAILYWDQCHFVVLAEITDKFAVVHDPAHGRRRLPLGALEKHFSEVAIEFQPGPGFEQQDRRLHYSAMQLMRGVVLAKRDIVTILSLGVAAEALGSAPAILLQHLIDRIGRLSPSLLLSVVIGCAGVYAIRAGAALTRAHLITTLSLRVSFAWLGSVFAHFLRLPQTYFDSRHVGDIVSRFGSITTIQKGITAAGTQTIVDGLLVLASFATMAYYSMPLTGLAVLALAAYHAYRWKANDAVQAGITEQMVFSSQQQTHFYETAKGIQSIRLFNREDARMHSWVQKLGAQYDAETSLQRLYNR